MQSLCESCRYRRWIVSGKGARFLLCKRALAKTSAASHVFPKYPPQPVVHCVGFETALPHSTPEPPVAS